MKYENGEVSVAPKTVYWVGIPPVIGKAERIELLKNDIFIIDFDEKMGKFSELLKGQAMYSVFFFNIERMMREESVERQSMLDYARNLATFITTLGPDRCMVHTGIIDKELANIFRSEGIVYLEKNMNDRKKAIATLLELIKPFFIRESKVSRSVVRINLSSSKYKFDLVNLTSPEIPKVTGYLRDLSLNSLGLILDNPGGQKLPALKDWVQVRLYMSGYIIKIIKSLITRVDPDKGELAVTFNINDDNMIKENYANTLSANVYNWLKGVIERHGVIKEN